MQTKLQKLLDFMGQGLHGPALRLAASWGRRGLGNGLHAEAILKGWAAYSNPAFYRELGEDPTELMMEGIRAIRARYKC